jgi:DNA-binding NarL/FixJ family response regulator
VGLRPFTSRSDAVLEGLSSPEAGDHPGKGLLSEDDWRRVGVQFRLTERELSVAILIFEGETRSQVARQLQCAPGTVRVYIDRLFAKLGVRDRLGMALCVVRTHLSSASSDMNTSSHKSAT